MVKRKSSIAMAAMAGLISGGAGLVGCNHHDQPAAAGVQATSSDSTATVGKHDCKGMNACKGQGGCKTDANACKGQNSCKGKGGCNTNKPQ
ncbi:MAG TPA: hypothetical protein VG269_12240 [Tepidisphaeraceae bacterium]|jgi:hypothetical protein|nr:hypothetical protein [Tepidisphaeraceae bacterium]